MVFPLAFLESILEAKAPILEWTEEKEEPLVESPSSISVTESERAENFCWAEARRMRAAKMAIKSFM